MSSGRPGRRGRLGYLGAVGGRGTLCGPRSFHCLSLAFRCPSTALSLPSTALPLPFHWLFLAFHSLFSASRRTSAIRSFVPMQKVLKLPGRGNIAGANLRKIAWGVIGGCTTGCFFFISCGVCRGLRRSNSVRCLHWARPPGPGTYCAPLPPFPPQVVCPLICLQQAPSLLPPSSAATASPFPKLETEPGGKSGL